MSEKYFEKFQLISYGNTAAVNITQRTVILNSVYTNPNLYYMYDIKPYERPDIIADEYYQDQYMSWILYLTNKIIDPYYDWHIDQETFKAFLIKKYGSYENATSKVKYYRNNWYTEPEQITMASYDTLVSANGAIAKYYTPVYLDETKNTIPNGYIRRREDWKYNTNRIATYTANGTSFITDEIVNVNFDINDVGRGQVTFANSTTVILQHLSGVTTTGTVVGSSYLYGRESKANTIFTDVTLLTDNIPTNETIYWEPVTYNQYETEINEQNKTIQVLNKSFSTQISKELRRLLK